MGFCYRLMDTATLQFGQAWSTQVGSKCRAADRYLLSLSSSAVLISAPECLFQLEIFCLCKFCPQQEGRSAQLDHLTFKTWTKPRPRPPRSNFEARGSAASRVAKNYFYERSCRESGLQIVASVLWVWVLQTSVPL